jgi:hypothetical protein
MPAVRLVGLDPAACVIAHRRDYVRHAAGAKRIYVIAAYPEGRFRDTLQTSPRTIPPSPRRR